MQLVVVRHGQSTNNANFITALARHRQLQQEDARIGEELTVYQNRVPDPELTELGLRQALSLGGAVGADRAPFVPTHLYASPMIRAVSTARPLAQACRLPITLQPDAYEVGGVQDIDEQTGARSRCVGSTLQKLQSYGGDLIAPQGLFPAADQPWSGGFEAAVEEAFPRAQRLLSTLLSAHRVQDVVVLVCHQFFAQFVIAAALNWNSAPWMRFRLDNTGHIALRLQRGGALVEWVNRVDHLEPADVTN